jgi:tRNA threonylcarbamoyladenosine biosynthesis protein TsaE
MIPSSKTEVSTPEDTQKVAQALRDALLAENEIGLASGSPRHHAQVIGLYGDLGAGKTTFMQFFGATLGVKEKMASPTFVLEKIYPISKKDFDKLIHIDAYRIDDPKEMLAIGWEEIVKDPRNIICVEWADKIDHLFPEHFVRIDLTHREGGKREISIRDSQA